MSLSRGFPLAQSFGTFTGGYGGALAIEPGIRYKGRRDNNSLDCILRVSKAYASTGKTEVILKKNNFSSNTAWRSGGHIHILGGKTISQKGQVRVQILDNSIIENGRSVDGVGGGIAYSKGETNGDYECEDETCDSNLFTIFPCVMYSLLSTFITSLMSFLVIFCLL